MAPERAEDNLMREFEFYLANQDALVEQYDGKVIAIKDDEVIGAYDSSLEAVMETQNVHALGTFLIQKVSPGEADYTVTIHSPRVTFMAHAQVSIEKNRQLGRLLAE